MVIQDKCKKYCMVTVLLYLTAVTSLDLCGRFEYVEQVELNCVTPVMCMCLIIVVDVIVQANMFLHNNLLNIPCQKCPTTNIKLELI